MKKGRRIDTTTESKKNSYVKLFSDCCNVTYFAFKHIEL